MAVRFSELLLREGRITPAQLEVALSHQRTNGGRLGATLVRLGLLGDDDVALVLSRQHGVPAIRLAEVDVDPAVIRLIPVEAAVRHQVVPVARHGSTLTLAMTDPANVEALDDIAFITGLHLEPVVCSDAALQQAIGTYYREALPGIIRVRPPMPSRSGDPPSDGQDGGEFEVLDDGGPGGTTDADEQGADQTVIRLVNALMRRAIDEGASDITCVADGHVVEHE